MPTTELGQDRADIAREIETLILQRLARTSQKAIAVETGCSESTVSRIGLRAEKKRPGPLGWD